MLKGQRLKRRKIWDGKRKKMDRNVVERKDRWIV